MPSAQGGRGSARLPVPTKPLASGSSGFVDATRRYGRSKPDPSAKTRISWVVDCRRQRHGAGNLRVYHVSPTAAAQRAVARPSARAAAQDVFGYPCELRRCRTVPGRRLRCMSDESADVVDDGSHHHRLRHPAQGSSAFWLMPACRGSRTLEPQQTSTPWIAVFRHPQLSSGDRSCQL